jgi:hypothetical protein
MRVLLDIDVPRDAVAAVAERLAAIAAEDIGVHLATPGGTFPARIGRDEEVLAEAARLLKLHDGNERFGGAMGTAGYHLDNAADLLYRVRHGR